MIGTEFQKHTGHLFRQGGFVDTQQMRRRPAGVGQGTDQVEYGPHAHLFPNAGDMAHRPGRKRREKKSEADFPDTALHVGGGDIQVYSEVGQHIRRSEKHGSRPVSVPYDFDTRSGDNERSGCGNVEGARAFFTIVAGLQDGFPFHIDIVAFEIQQVVSRIQFQYPCIQGLCGTGDFIHGFALGPQSSDKRCNLGR